MKTQELIDWVKASPKQRMVVLKVINFGKRTSENIRERAKKFNPHLTRQSTFSILKELGENGLVQTSRENRTYWITRKGREVLNGLCLK